MRTAYGMFLYGNETGNAEIMKQATGVFQLMLNAPNKVGAFPSIFWLDTVTMET